MRVELANSIFSKFHNSTATILDKVEELISKWDLAMVLDLLETLSSQSIVFFISTVISLKTGRVRV